MTGYTLIQALEDFAELAEREGQWARMTRLLGAAEAQREAMGQPLPPRERGEYDRLPRPCPRGAGRSGCHQRLESGAGRCRWSRRSRLPWKDFPRVLPLAEPTGD